jgi:hypothetical protein
MLSENVDAINTFGFDGAHIDQLGQRQGVLRANETPIDLPSAFVSFLGATSARLSSNNAQKAACTFNLVDGTVNGWAIPQVAGSALRSIGQHRPVVLAGYAQCARIPAPFMRLRARRH